MSWLSASEGLTATARWFALVVTVATAACAAAVFVADHGLKYNVANLVTQEQFQRQGEQIRKQSEELHADLRADLRMVPVLDGRTEELSKTTAALVAARERRPWW